MDLTDKTRVIAMVGKGGVGKTSITALMVKILAKQHGKRILVIDADPAVGLATALGVPVGKTVDDIRNELIKSIKKGERQDNIDTVNRLDYEVFDALAQGEKFAFLAIGRPEDEGCYCRVNSLLKDIIRDLAENFDTVIIDGEAGVEQINRRVMKTVNHLIMVSDTSAKGINVVNTIRHVAQDNKAVDYESIGFVLNRVRSEDEVKDIGSRVTTDLLGWIPEDDLIREYDFQGTSLLGLPESSAPVQSIQDVLNRLRTQ